MELFPSVVKAQVEGLVKGQNNSYQIHQGEYYIHSAFFSHVGECLDCCSLLHHRQWLATFWCLNDDVGGASGSHD